MVDLFFQLLTHDTIVTMANVFAIVPDHWSLVIVADELVLYGDGAYMTGETLGSYIY